MPGKFDKFTERARQVMTYAQEEARGLNHNYLGTEHILLGLMRVEEGVAAKILAGFGAGPERVRAAIEAVIGRGTEPPTGELTLTPRAKKTLDLSVDEAKRLNHDYIGTEHLLLGLLREGEGVAAQILATFGATPETARAQILQHLAISTPQESRIRQLVAQWGDREQGRKRYNLVLPEDLFEEVQRLADRQQTTVVELLRRFTKLGLLVTQIQETPGAALIIREGDREREILLL